MQVIHFTAGAADPVAESQVQDVRFVHLAQGVGESRLGCIHIAAQGEVPKLPVNEDCALLVVHGAVRFSAHNGLRLDLEAGVGVVLEAGEHCRLESPEGAILMMLECGRLEPTQAGLSSPDRIRGQLWPGDISHKGHA